MTMIIDSRTVHLLDGKCLNVGNYVDERNLTDGEMKVWDSRHIIFQAFNNIEYEVSSIRIVETIRYQGEQSFVMGCCDTETNEILISRVVLSNIEQFLGVLIHEIVHAKTHEHDGTIQFERGLTDFLGYIAASFVKTVDYKVTDIVPAESLDTKGTAYVTCRCVDCLSDDLEHNDDLSWVRCKSCGREYLGGYNELVNLLRHYMENNNAQIFQNEAIGNVWKWIASKGKK